MENEMHYGSDYKYIPAISISSGESLQVLPDVYCHTIQIVNVCWIGSPESKDFVLVDAGMPGSANEIIRVTEERFGQNSRPKCIILTHGHFDHVGALIELIDHWKVPVYAHHLELPFLTGERAYPEPDPTVEGGMIAKMSLYFPNEPIVLGNHIKSLPEDGSIPGAPGFQAVETPGHSPGHISLFRESDRALIAGDAFVTVRQDELYKVLTQDQEVNGPPRYYTTDWQSAWDSVRKLAALNPTVAVTGHGTPISGQKLTDGLDKLVHEFDLIAIPEYGKYVNGPYH